MTDQGRKDLELDAELDRLGEEAASPEERALAARLVGRLAGAPQAVGEPSAEEELAALAELSRILGGGASGAAGGQLAAQAARVGEVATGRALDEIFGSGAAGDSLGEPEAPRALDTVAGVATGAAAGVEAGAEAPTDELEARRAKRLAETVDRLVAGAPMLAGALGGDEAALVETAEIVRASTHARRLSAARTQDIVDEALGRARAPRRYRGGRVLLAVGLAGALAASVVGLVMLWGQEARRGPEVPAHLASRSTRDILPGAFPRSQSESERIDLIYHDRLRAYRDVELGALAPAPDAPLDRRAAPVAALAGRLGRGGIP